MNNISIGNSGEYFVAAELERRGICVGVPMSNVKDFDILAINMESNNQYAVQVKTTMGNNNKWILSKKNENIVGDNIVYIFVKLDGLNTPSYYIVPSKTVAEYIKIRHEEWLKTPGINGQPHNDNNIREFIIDDEKYLNNWDIFQ